MTIAEWANIELLKSIVQLLLPTMTVAKHKREISANQ